MIKWKKLSAVLLVSSLIMPLAPYQVFAEEEVEKDNIVISEPNEYEVNADLHNNVNESNIYTIDQISQEAIKIDTFNYENQRYFIDDEVNINNQVFVFVSSETEKIGWVILSSLEEANIDLIDNTSTVSMNNSINIHNNQESIISEDISSQLTKQQSEINSISNVELTKEESIVNTDESIEQINDLNILESTAATESSLMTISSTSDTLDILSTKDVSYAAEIVKSWSINTLPWGTDGARFVESAENHLGKTVIVKQEKETSRSIYALIAYNDQELGWIDVTGIKPHTIIETNNVDYTVEVTKPWSVNTQPWGTSGFTLSIGESILGEEYIVKKESRTQRSTYVLLTKDDKNIGWIDFTGVQERQPVLSEKSIQYAAEVIKPWSVNTRPWGTTGSVKVSADGEYMGKKVTVSSEITTPRATYAAISIGDKQLGWVDKTALDILTVINVENVNYSAIITKPWSINSMPWGIEGYKTIIESAPIGAGYTATKEAETARSSYVLLEKNGEEVGWIDITGIDKATEIIFSRDVTYAADIIKPWTINTNPYGTIGSKRIMSAADIIGKNVTVSKEKKTEVGTYALISLNNKELGWIDKTGLNPIKIINEQLVNYDVSIIKPWSVNTRPWGTNGYSKVLDGISIIGNDYKVTKEATTSRGTYALLVNNNNEEIGWIDYTGVHKYMVASTSSSVNYSAEIVRNWSINSQPYGTKGALRIANGEQYYGETVNIIEEKITNQSTYALIELDGVVIGWIDKDALDTRRIIMIDPGHGGVDPGAYGVINGRRINEKDLNLTVSLKLRNILEKQGYTVLMTRDDDSTVISLDRGRITNRSNADLFLSVHHNSMPKTYSSYSSIYGIESFYYKYNPDYPSKLIPDTHDNPYKLAEGFKLAYAIQNSLITETGARYRRVDDAAFIVIKEVEIPAALTELGFLTNQYELSKLVTDSYQNDLARGLAIGINNYFNK